MHTCVLDKFGFGANCRFSSFEDLGSKGLGFSSFCWRELLTRGKFGAREQGFFNGFLIGRIILRFSVSLMNELNRN